MDCAENESVAVTLLKLNNVCSYIKRRWVNLNQQWPKG